MSKVAVALIEVRPKWWIEKTRIPARKGRWLNKKSQMLGNFRCSVFRWLLYLDPQCTWHLTRSISAFRDCARSAYQPHSSTTGSGWYVRPGTTTPFPTIPDPFPDSFSVTTLALRRHDLHLLWRVPSNVRVRRHRVTVFDSWPTLWGRGGTSFFWCGGRARRWWLWRSSRGWQGWSWRRKRLNLDERVCRGCPGGDKNVFKNNYTLDYFSSSFLRYEQEWLKDWFQFIDTNKVIQDHQHRRSISCGNLGKLDIIWQPPFQR